MRRFVESSFESKLEYSIINYSRPGGICTSRRTIFQAFGSRSRDERE